MHRALLIVVALMASLPLAACGDDAATPGARTTRTLVPDTTRTTTTSTPTTTSPATGIDTMPGASTRPVHEQATNTETALLTDVRAARHEGFDRIVFQFRNALPGYDVRYVTGPVRQDGSGKVVPLAGNAIVRIRMENALDADLSQGDAPLTYTGPQRFTPKTPEIAELARAGGFEGVLTWVAGTQDKADLRVTTLANPPRLIVDVRNH